MAKLKKGIVDEAKDAIKTKIVKNDPVKTSLVQTEIVVTDLDWSKPVKTSLPWTGLDRSATVVSTTIPLTAYDKAVLEYVKDATHITTRKRLILSLRQVVDDLVREIENQ